MPNFTKNYNLRKPLPEEFYDINEHNSNMDIIDGELAKRAMLGDDNKVLREQLPDMDYIPTSEKGKAGGVAALNAEGKLEGDIFPEGVGGGSGKRTARFSIGSSQYGWTASDCDFLCDGTADEVEINAAIQTLRSTGGEIVLLDGVYHLSSKILMDKNGITLTGNGANTKIIRAFNDDEYDPEQGLILIKNSFCTVRNLYFDCMNGTYTSNNAINLYDGDNCTIADNTIVNCTGDGIYAVGNYHTIHNNIIQNCFQGLYLSDCTKTTVTNNRVEEAQSAGVYLYNVEDVVINNNVVENCADSGIKFQNCNESTFVGNVCNYNAQCGIYITRGDNNVICGNTCNGNGNFAIYVGTTPKNNILVGNTYFDNSTGTISLGSTKNVTYSESDHKHDASDITSGLDTLIASMSSAKIATGTYKGTGTYGKDNAMIFNIGFVPKFFAIYSSLSGTIVEIFVHTDKLTSSYSSNEITFPTSTVIYGKISGTDLYLYGSSQNGGKIFNNSLNFYYWYAIG